LGPGGHPAPQGPHQGNAELFRDRPRDLLGLIEASAQLAAPVQRHGNDQIDVFEEVPVASTQGPADPCAQKRQAPEFQGMNHLDER
jgi:hypothetical protein